MATIRSTMFDLIKDLRRKVFDYEPEALDVDEFPPGDTIEFTIYFKDHAGILTNPSASSVLIKDSENNVRVAAGTLTATATTGTYLYYYATPATCVPGDWLMQATGTVGTYASVKPDVFKVRERHYLWTDEELQRIYDRHRIRVNREELSASADWMVYSSQYENLESALLYDGDDSGASAISTALYTTDLNVGEFTFTTATDSDIYMDGLAYDIYGTAAELLRELLADPSRAKSFSRGAISQQGYDLRETIKDYERRSTTGGMGNGQFNRIYDG